MADRLAGEGGTAAAQQVRVLHSPAGCARWRRRGSCRCPKSSPRAAAEKESPPTELKEIRTGAAAELFELAQRAARSESPQYALASRVPPRSDLERQPDHKEARRLLGYVPHEGGWARPFAVEQLQKGNVNHPIFGWVPAGLGAAPGPRRAAGPAGSRPEKDALAPRRGGRSPPRRLETPLVVRHRALRDPDQRAARRGDQFRPPARGVSRPVHDASWPTFSAKTCRCPPIQGPVADRRRPPLQAASGLLLRLQGANSSSISARSQGPEIADSLGFYDPPKSGRAAACRPTSSATRTARSR